ncbi:MAG TPA: ATP-binding protein [Gemmatimonadaceae bacterium]|nr:ATP-binding protein [Gemmatimonadaceae bacterium]
MRHGFRMSVGAEPGGVEKVNAALADFAETYSLPEAVRRSVNVAVDELLANVVSHGTGRLAACSVTVDGTLDQDRLTVTLTDDGPPFDPFSQAAPDTTLSVEDRPIGGLGIHLVRELMDEFSYERKDGHNVVVLVKAVGPGKGKNFSGAS